MLLACCVSSPGTFPIVALMTANAVNRVSLSACGDGDSASGLGISSNETGDCGLDQCEEIRVSVAITLSMMVGVIMVSSGILCQWYWLFMDYDYSCYVWIIFVFTSACCKRKICLAAKIN